MALESNPTGAGTEQTLVSQAIDGDADAFGTLYTNHLDAIFRFVFFRVADVPLAEDLTEEVFVRAWTALPNYQSRGHRFSSWLYRIAHNLLVDHFRRHANLATDDSVSMETLPDPKTLPEDRVSELQEMAGLARAVQQLGQDEQYVIILRFVEGLSHREVAQAIGKSEGASRVIQHRALEALADILESDE